jgi:hypothetical protein
MTTYNLYNLENLQNKLLTTFYKLLITNYILPTTYYLLPTTYSTHYITAIPCSLHSSSAISRSLNFWILPLPVSGYSSTKNT